MKTQELSVLTTVDARQRQLNTQSVGWSARKAEFTTIKGNQFARDRQAESVAR